MSVRRTERSAAAAQYRRWYQSKVWRDLRRAQLLAEPLCRYCRARGRTTAATVVNHRTPHKGNWDLFSDPANLESVCKPCHDGEIQSRERTGRDYSLAIGADGWPADPEHPTYRGKPKR